MIEKTEIEYKDVQDHEIWVYNSYGLDELGNNEELGQRALWVLAKSFSYVEAKEYPDGKYIYIGYDRLIEIATPEKYPEYFL